MSPPRNFDRCETTEPLQPTLPPDDDAAMDNDARRDDVPVLACENGVCQVQSLPAKKSKYLKTFRWPRRLCSLRCREVVVLGVGVTLTLVSIGLIVAGAFRSAERSGTRSAFLHVSSMLKRLPGQNRAHQDVTDQSFTFQQLLFLNNYALNKPTQQSSVFLEVLDIPELDGEADFAVDGSVSTCARTDPEYNPFWLVDMGQIEHIRSVRLYGSDANKLHDLEVYVGNSENVTDNTLCTRLHSNPRVLDVRIVCDSPRTGRYVGVIQRTQPGRPESLIICEALVYLL
ncbi:uncharacterized protein [Littorina saxatilis]|uniref:Fucolectin tachylectin-4 pentraxin-1 domain-containing protein n=1 Tax=Littorina saxatilis TaxID=31220 RepID=A0AAN9BCB4_9CAEN